MPFSDPMADGPTIQESSVRSLTNGTKINDIFKIVMNVRKFNNEIPIILMGYYNSIFNLGIEL
jgi:tryptophan synthase alpha chain